VKFAGWDPEFHELMIPLYITASDKVSQRGVIIQHGRVFDAVRASLARPAHIKRQKLGNMELADGAVFSPLRTEILYSEGADFVIGIQAKPIRSATKRELPIETKLQPYLLKIMGWKPNADVVLSKPGCEILLRPRVPKELTKDRRRVGEIIDLGIKITFDAMTELEQTQSDMTKSAVRARERARATEVRTTRQDIDQEFSNVIEYTTELTNGTEAISDAELMELFPAFARAFQAFMTRLTSEYPDAGELGNVLRSRFKDLTDAVNESAFFKRCLEKPLGYAGDYQMMNYIYDYEVFEASTNMAKLLNYFMMSHPATNAVRNRAKVVQGLVQQRAAQFGSLRVASIACGPAREVAGAMQMCGDMGGTVKWSLLDQDKEALDYARRGLPHDGRLEAKIINGSVRDLVKRELSLGEQDIIYSLGLFDYLDAKTATILLQRLYAELNHGGLLVIGNFSEHPGRSFMEVGMEWHLIYRSRDELLDLSKAAAPDADHFVMTEPEGVNLILVCSKPLQPFA